MLRRAMSRWSGRVGCEWSRFDAATAMRGIEVKVSKDDPPEKAMKKLKKRMNEEGDTNKIKAQRFRTEPCQQRRMQRKERAHRQNVRVFKYKLNWILQRRARGF